MEGGHAIADRLDGVGDRGPDGGAKLREDRAGGLGLGGDVSVNIGRVGHPARLTEIEP